jgi:PKHD-type hydroxylase
VLVITNLLDAATVEAIRADLDAAPFRDGAESAGASARGVKRNREAPWDAPALEARRKQLTRALLEHRTVAQWALPRRATPVLFNRYDVGMAYGDHVDNAIGLLGGGATVLRTDVAVTIFLSDPASYDGGELVIGSDEPGPGGGGRRVKLPAGEAILYEASTLHRVEPITRGTRLAAVCWIESLVRDAAARAVLWDLAQAARAIPVDAEPPLADARLRIEKARANLLRRWVET